MARPPKKPEMRMDTDLRIPVTEDQKSKIKKTAENAEMDMAAWARQILLAACEQGRRNENH